MELRKNVCSWRARAGGGAVVDTSEGARYDIPDYILPDREASSKRGGVRYCGTGNDRQAQTSELLPLVFAFHGQTCNFYQHRLLHYHRPSTHPLGHLRPPPPTPTCWDLHLLSKCTPASSQTAHRQKATAIAATDILRKQHTYLCNWGVVPA